MRLNNRQKEADKELDKILKQTENKLGRQYAIAMKGIRSELAEMYAKAKGDPSLAQMSKYNNLENRRKGISKELTKLFASTRSETFNMMESSYLESYFREAHELEFSSQRKLGFGQINEKVVQEAIDNPVSGRSIRSRFVKNRRRLFENIDEGITQGLIRGESYREMAKNIQENFMDKDFDRALTTARTEAHRIQSSARDKAYDEAISKGVEAVKVWDATLDTDTRSDHQDLDGVEADEDGLFHMDGATATAPGLFGVARQDINCRCSLRIQVKGYEDNVRRARVDGQRGGKSELVTSPNYNQWKEDKGIK